MQARAAWAWEGGARVTEYRVALGKAADDLVLTAEAPLTERRFGA